MSFADMIKQERDALAQRRNKVVQQMAELEDKLAEIDREWEAINAYEAVKTGKAPTVKAVGGKRRSGVRDDVKAYITSNPGAKRADILDGMGVKGDKSGEQSISNALANLKKSGAIVQNEEQGYEPA